ncbi:MAG: UvrD-helicase domain-containing protein [Candidatus Margulisbacteria bacterium]|nr:UvrD-helicase domain-containing protein [Candidatus Margulisiibacteriota bacterium]
MKNDMANKTFTDTQKKALTLGKNIFIYAGPGSGKTAMLVERYVQFLKENPNLSGKHILAITFTEKAAMEMRARIQTSLNLEKRLFHLNQAHIETIHAFCYAALTRFQKEAKLKPTFSVRSAFLSRFSLEKLVSIELDSLAVHGNAHLKSCLTHFSIQKLRQILMVFLQQTHTTQKWFSHNETLSIEDLQAHISPENLHQQKATIMAWEQLDHIKHIYLHCYSVYQTQKNDLSHLDYEDLLIQTRALLKNNLSVLKAFQQQFKCIMIDECQDIDPLQWEIISLLADSKDPFSAKKLFLVGDMHQSIYSFRGSDTALFNTLYNHFLNRSHDSLVVLNMDNYRSTTGILKFLNPLFQQIFENSTCNTLIPHRKDTRLEPISLLWHSSQQKPQNHHHIITWMKQQIKRKPDLKWSDFAILTRRKKNVLILEDLLSQHGIPTQTNISHGFYHRPEIQELCLLIKGLENPSDHFSWIGVLKSAFFCLSDEVLFLMCHYFPEENILLSLDRVKNLSPSQMCGYGFKKTDQQLILEAAYLIPKWVKRFTTTSLIALLNQLLIESGAWAIYQSMPNGSQIIQAIDQFLDHLETFIQDSIMSQESLTKLLAFAMDHPENDPIPVASSKNGVSLLTIHSAKGLAFSIVILPYLETPFNFGFHAPLIMSNRHGMGLHMTYQKEENILRKQVREGIKKDMLEEEKRLFYVAATRAKDALVLAGCYSDSTTSPNRSPKSIMDLIQSYCTLKQEHAIFSFESGTQTYPLNAAVSGAG